MRNRSLLLCFFLLLACVAWAQNPTPPPTFTVKGVLLDSLTNETGLYATIRIANKSLPEKPVKMATTDGNGKFQERFLAYPGRYIITLTAIGKLPVVREFELDAEKTVVDLGTLRAAESATELQDAEVVF